MTTHLERRLLDVADRLKRQRAELAVTEEQLAFLEEEAEDARLRALVAETPIVQKDASEARRQADALARQRDALLRSIVHLETEQDSLLDQMSSSLAGET